MMSEGVEERTHYHFSHAVVPRLAFSDPEALYQDLSDGAEALAKLWRALNSDAAHVTPFLLTRVGDPAWGEAFLIEMPRLEADSLAVAMVVVFERVDFDERSFPHRVRYFTLEKGPSLATRAPEHYLCEWEPGRGHANWGMLPGS